MIAFSSTASAAGPLPPSAQAPRSLRLRRSPRVTAIAAACTQTISGPHTGVLIVAGDQKLCLLGAVQNGAGNVAPDGGLSVIGSTITGVVTLKDGHSELEFCGSKTVLGAISATGGKTVALIGGAGAGALTCTSNVPAPINAGVSNAVGGGRSGRHALS